MWYLGLGFDFSEGVENFDELGVGEDDFVFEDLGVWYGGVVAAEGEEGYVIAERRGQLGTGYEETLVRGQTHYRPFPRSPCPSPISLIVQAPPS